MIAQIGIMFESGFQLLDTLFAVLGGLTPTVFETYGPQVWNAQRCEITAKFALVWLTLGWVASRFSELYTKHNVT